MKKKLGFPLMLLGGLGLLGSFILIVLRFTGGNLTLRELQPLFGICAVSFIAFSIGRLLSKD